MFKINTDLTIEITRGDAATFNVTAQNKGETYVFQAGDIVRFKVFEKKGCECVVLQKDFAVNAATEEVSIDLTETDTKIGNLINKPKDYWYEVELNPDTYPQTIIGYDEDGAKVFKLYPEGRDFGGDPVKPEDIPFVDKELNMTSHNPVENQAIAKEFAAVKETIAKNAGAATEELKKVVYRSGGTLTGNLNMGGYKVTGLADPVSDSDAVHLGYVNRTYAPKSHTENKQNPHGVTAEQVGARPNTWTPTAADVGALPKAGGTMSGAINMGSKKITNLATPTADADASTKKYVDDGLSAKQDAITGLSKSMVMICDQNGNIRTSSTVSTGDLQALSGIDSNIQTQLDGKEPTITTLPLEKGGTGATTANGANQKILGGMGETTAALTDASMLVFKYSNPSPDTGAVFYKKAPLLVDYIDEKLKVGAKIPKLTKLWTNAKPTSVFAGQTLSITLTGYDFIMIRYKTYCSESNYSCKFIKTTSNGVLETVSQGGKYRGVTITASSNSVTFGSVYNADDTAGTNDFLVPYEIYGCKLL